MMCERLFDRDAYLQEFDAAVTDCVEEQKDFLIALNRTAFYPEGGGQPGDTGRLVIPDSGEEIAVTDTFERAGKIWHRTGRPIAPGTALHGAIDWARRFSLMQNHSGEHIVSGLIHNTYGYENVGFHMGSEFITIDLSGELTAEQLLDIQRKANEIVWQDVQTEVRFYEGSSAIPFPYRSKKELAGQVRIVTFPGADICACCGTHVSSTGQIGLIKLISAVKFKGGVRIEMLCGRRAMDYLEEIWEQNHRISNLLSARPMQTAQAVERVKSAHESARFELTRLEKIKEENFAAAMKGRGNLVVISRPMNDPQGVRRLANAVMESCGGVCAVFAGSDETKAYQYAIGQKDGDVGDLVRDVNGSLNGRGGGKPFFAQGSIAAGKADIKALFSKAQYRDRHFTLIGYDTPI